MMEFRVLGSLEVVEDDRLVALGSPKQRALLAALLVHRPHPVSSDRLIDELWGESAPPTARKIVQGYVSGLRKVLGDGLVVSRGHGYLLQVDPDQTDVDRFESLVAEGHRALADGNPHAAAETLREALGLWRGPALADFAYESFAQSEISRLEETRLAALEDRIEAELALGEHARLVGELEALVQEYPLRERFIGQLMLALYRSGRQADALEAYRTARTRLIEELGLEPGPELRALEQRILGHDPTLGRPGATGATARIVGRSRARRGWVAIAAGGLLLVGAAIAAATVELTGRGAAGVRAAPNTVAVIDARTDRVIGAVAVGARPGAVALAPGAVWVANQDDETVSRVDPGTLATVRTLSLADPPTGIAAAGGGVWVATSSVTSSFVSASQIDPQFDRIGRTIRIGNVVPGTSAALAGGPDGLWVAPLSGELTRLDPQTGRVAQQLDPNAAPGGVAVGDGAVWVSDNSADTVTRIDPIGLTTAVPVGNSPSGIAFGDGAVWVADTGDNAVVRIDPDTRAVTATIPVGDSPTGIAFGGESVWVANSGDGTVTRINPATGKVTATIEVGGSPQQIAVADDRAWVTVDQPAVPPRTAVAAGGTARLDLQSDVSSMDPALAYDGSALQLLYATCAKLLNYPDKPGAAGSQLIPEVAQTLPTRSPDERTYTFTIRPGFRFSPPSNEPVTAQTFRSTIERVLNPGMQTKNSPPTASEFADIVGERAYLARKAAHISGVTASGDKLTIRLTAPAPDFLSRIAQTFFCAVPVNTPIDPTGLRSIPMAGPYQIASYTPGQGIVLTRNPNYHGNRPHRLARIEVKIGIPPHTAVTQVETGAADYAMNGEISASDAPTLAARYGPGSPAARAGHQQYFVTAQPELDFLALNSHRPLFANTRLRLAVSYAIDRAALAALGGGFGPLPDQPTDHYIPPGVPGFTDTHFYPLTGDPAKARQLAAGHQGATAILYTCDQLRCDQQAHLITTELAAIGLNVETKPLSPDALFTKILNPGEPFDMVLVPWAADYLDPDNFLNLVLETNTMIPAFNDPTYQTQLAAAARLSGPKRYLTYARIDADLTRNAAPWIAYGNASTHELFSARIGCQTYGVYDVDLAALCIRNQR